VAGFFTAHHQNAGQIGRPGGASDHWQIVLGSFLSILSSRLTASAQHRTGEQLVARYKAYKHANERLDDLILRIEGIWLRSTTQMSFVRKLPPSENLRLQTFQEECFRRLNVHLQTALVKLADISGQDLAAGINVAQLTIEAPFSKRLKYSLLEKHLKQLVSDLVSWHNTFDPSWYLLARIQHDDVDTLVAKADADHKEESVAVIKQIRELVQQPHTVRRDQKSLFVHSNYLTDERLAIEPTNLSLSILRQSGQQVLLDTTTYPDGTYQRQAKSFVRGLARLLSSPEISNLSLLRCLGILELDGHPPKTRQYQYIFGLPPQDSPPSSLRAILVESSPSLDVKVDLAKSLAKALTSLHAADFIHKNIRPETIIVLESAQKQKSVPFLVGFESLRPSEAHSSLISDMAWERNVYRHPSRQGLRPQEYYTMQHDIYSLGVCLLEIGLWFSFVDYTQEHGVLPSPALPIEALLDKNNKRQAANEIKDLLVEMAREKLPSMMGRTYTEVVVSSLLCLDKDTDNVFTNSEDLLDEDGIAIGVAFIQHILMRLDSISL